jgi:hypothetical protein
VHATVDSAAFADAVTRTVQVLDKKPAYPVLSGLLLQVRRGHLHIIGAGYGEASHTKVRAFGHRAGRAVAPGNQLAAIARHLGADTVTLSLRNGRLAIVSGATTWKLMTMPVEDYPTWPDEVIAERGNHADHAKRQPPGKWEHRMVRAERTIRHITAGFRPSRTRTLYEPEPFAVGDWVTVTTDDDRTLTGQMAAENVVILLHEDGTTTCHTVLSIFKPKYARYHIRHQLDEEAMARRDSDEPIWKVWDVRRAAGPPDQAPVATSDLGRDEATSAPDGAPPDAAPPEESPAPAPSPSAPVVFELPDPFEWRWPDFDPADLAVSE